MEEDHASVLRSDIGALAINLSRVMRVPKNVQKLIVPDLGWVVLYLDDFGVSCAISTDIFIGGIRGMPARVTGGRVDDAFEFSKSGFHTPKTSSSKRGFFSHCFYFRSAGIDTLDHNAT